MIIETIVSTISESGEVNFAPVGVRIVDEKNISMVLFHGSVTYANLSRARSGVINLTNDPLLFVKTALYDYSPEHTLSETVAGANINVADETVEFKITSVDQFENKSKFKGIILSRTNRKPPPVGFCRAPGAVIEALVAVTRIGILDKVEIEGTLRQCRIIIEKTGGPNDMEAMELVERFYEQKQQ